MWSERANESPNDKVFRVNEAQNAINSAVSKLGIARITHHDLRHLYATICIESGVDIPTVSPWLGHKDGGALALKTYGHLRREHSLAQAEKVSFAASVWTPRKGDSFRHCDRPALASVTRCSEST
jgi:integrase